MRSGPYTSCLQLTCRSNVFMLGLQSIQNPCRLQTLEIKELITTRAISTFCWSHSQVDVSFQVSCSLGYRAKLPSILPTDVCHRDSEDPARTEVVVNVVTLAGGTPFPSVVLLSDVSSGS